MNWTVNGLVLESNYSMHLYSGVKSLFWGEKGYWPKHQHKTCFAAVTYLQLIFFLTTCATPDKKSKLSQRFSTTPRGRAYQACVEDWVNSLLSGSGDPAINHSSAFSRLPFNPWHTDTLINSIGVNWAIFLPFFLFWTTTLGNVRLTIGYH